MLRRLHILVTAMACICAIVFPTGCTRGPEAEVIRREVQERLTTELKPGLFEITELRRRGSSTLPASDGGGQRLVVYYNATLRLLEDYEFGGWEKLSPASLAFTLGATVKGLLGVKPQSRRGELVRAYGSATYEWSSDGWKRTVPAQNAPTKPPPLGNSAAPSHSKQLVDELAAMVNGPPPGVDPTEDAVISDELSRATENIQRRLERRERIYTFASGPAGGEYARFANAVVDSAREHGIAVGIRNFETEGSLQNAWLLARGEADYALVQNDIAAEALSGAESFARGGPLASLRALGSLFPETVHLVVATGSPIHEVAELRNRRVDLGTPNSGTQHDAAAVLEASGLRTSDLAEATQVGFGNAVLGLREGRLDAFFVTIAAPSLQLQELFARQQVRLLPLPSSGIERLVSQHPGLLRMTLPANTYPGQKEEIATVAATALLVTTNDVPDAEVERVLTFVFSQLDFQAAGSAEGSRVSRQTALQGITIPMHPGASRFFGATQDAS